MTSSAPNINRLWADLLVEELVRLGVTQFVLAPGSRSTPLVTAIADNPRAHPLIHFDERGGAFCALGQARATGMPVAWVTTSGTAVANGLPAVVEAAQENVPLILLTADRPPELRDAGANQTIDQQKIFGGFVRWYFDLPAPTQAVDPQFVLTTIDQAVHRARSSPAGPVQVNCMFREPLAPVEDGQDYRAHLSLVSRWERSDRPFTRYALPDRPPPAESIQELASAIEGVEQGVIVASRLKIGSPVSCIRELAEALNWPLLTGANSQLRFDGEEESPLPHHLMLLSPDFREAVKPHAVIQFGPPAISNRLMQYIRSSAPDVYAVVHDGPTRTDPDHVVTRRFDCTLDRFCEALLPHVRPSSPRWIGRWTNAARAARQALDAALAADDTLSEPWLASTLPQLLPPEAGLFLGNSMPVRDVDAYAFRGGRLRVTSNRGASGIDGNLASAVGLCRALEEPTAVLIGDLTLLHDLNSLALCRQVSQPFPIVVVNNDGGGIFSFLQIAQFEEVFERYFGTPHGVHFEQAARMFDVPYAAPRTRAAFQQAVSDALQRTGPSLIEIEGNRTENAALHRAIDEQVGRAVGSALLA